MKKELRKGKVFIDWSQNDRHKTTVARVLAARARAPDGLHAAELGRGRGDRRAATSPFEAARRARARGGARRPVRPVLELEQELPEPLASVDDGRLVARPPDRAASPPARMPRPPLAVDLAAVAREIEPCAWRRYTGLDAAGRLPPPEVVSRAGVGRGQPRRRWPQLLDPVAERLDDRLGAAGPFAGALRMGAGVTLAAEVGPGHRLHVPARARPVRAVAARPRRAAAAAVRGAQPRPARRATSESTARASCAGSRSRADARAPVPARALAARAPRRPVARSTSTRSTCGSSAARAGGLPSLPNPADLVERFREGGLVALVQTREQRELHGPDAGHHGGGRGPRRARDGRRSRPSWCPSTRACARRWTRAARTARPPSGCSSSLLGFDMKMRQYEVGKRFCDAVVAEGGIELLNRVWALARGSARP